MRVQLVDIQLRLDVLAHVVLERRRPRLDEVDGGAGAVEGGSGEGAVVAGADAVAVECGGAVGHRRRPFADHEPLVAVGGVRRDVAADELPMLGRLHGSKIIAEDLVFMVVDDHVLGVVVLRSEKAIPGLDGVEAVVEDDGGVADLADVVEAIAVVLLGCGAAAGDVGEEGFIEELDGNDDILVGRDGVFGCDLRDYLVGEGGGVAGGPFRGAGSLAGVVEAVLGERGSWREVSLVL